MMNNYIENQHAGGLPLSIEEFTTDGLEDVPDPPSEAAEGDAKPLSTVS